MLVFQEMPAEEVLKALEGHQDILTPSMKAHELYFKTLSCPRCGEGVTAFVDPRQLFRTGDIIPKFLARCKSCKTEFEPYTKIEVKGPAR